MLKILPLFFLLFSFAFSKPLVKTEYIFYNIYPTDKHDLEKSMDSTSPLVNQKSIRHGTVNWKIDYRYKRERRHGICMISAVRTRVDVKYIVPKIPKDFNASNGVKTAFNRYYEILIDYLDKNRDNAKKAASELEKELVKIKPKNNDCELIRKDAKRVAKTIIKKYKKKSKDYEIRTYEGFLDGLYSEKLL